MLRRLRCAITSGALALLVALTAAAPAAHAQHRDLIETAERAGSFSTLLAALDAAGLTQTIRDADALTILAPTDDAFAQLPRGAVARLLRPENRDELRAVLLYHVIEGSVPARTVRTLDAAPTLNGQRVTITTDSHGLRVDGERVVTADVRASNGVIHVIDGVLLSETKTLVGVAQAAGAFGTLLAAAEAAGLVDALSGDDALTVFAPTDAAFEALPRGTVQRLLRPENRGELRDLLLYHVVPGRQYATDVLGSSTLTTLEGRRIRPRLQNGAPFVNGSRITQTNIEATNGVIHVIDAVLLPPADETTSRSAAPRMEARQGDAGPAALIRAAIDRGVPLFNRGDADACAAVYEVAALALADDRAVPSASRRALLRAAESTGSARDRAWTLRRALDDTLEALDGQRMRSSASHH